MAVAVIRALHAVLSTTRERHALPASVPRMTTVFDLRFRRRA